MIQHKIAKIKKMIKNLWKQYWSVIIALVATPIVLGVSLKIPFTNIDNGSNDGWLGFWGGYLASIITIIGVYWQVRKQSEDARANLRLTFEEQAKQNAKAARPRFIFELSHQKLLNEKIYFLNAAPESQPESFFKWVAKSDPIFTIVRMENVSDEIIVNAKVKLIYRKNHKGGTPDKVEWFIIRRINPHSTFLYVPKGTETDSIDADGIDMVDIWITTSTGEKIYYRLVDSYSNQMFNTLMMMSSIDLPDSLEIDEQPPKNEYDTIRVKTDYVSDDGPMFSM